MYRTQRIAEFLIACTVVATMLSCKAVATTEFKPISVNWEPIPIIQSEPIKAQQPDHLLGRDVVEYISITEELDEGLVYYIAQCIQAEAGNQSELGQRLVCDTIINRYNRGGYNSIYEVINAEGQYDVVSSGAITKAKPSEEVIQIVKEEYNHPVNSEVIYFKTKGYHSFGTPIIQEGEHYFSK